MSLQEQEKRKSEKNRKIKEYNEKIVC